MKKTFRLVDLDCANCAATIEADDAEFDAVVKRAVDCIKKVEPDCTVILK